MFGLLCCRTRQVTRNLACLPCATLSVRPVSGMPHTACCVVLCCVTTLFLKVYLPQLSFAVLSWRVAVLFLAASAMVLCSAEPLHTVFAGSQSRQKMLPGCQALQVASALLACTNRPSCRLHRIRPKLWAHMRARLTKALLCTAASFAEVVFHTSGSCDSLSAFFCTQHMFSGLTAAAVGLQGLGRGSVVVDADAPVGIGTLTSPGIGTQLQLERQCGCGGVCYGGMHRFAVKQNAVVE